MAAARAMFGVFQQSNLRVEIDASEALLRESLLRPAQYRQWLWPQRFSADLPEQLQSGTTFTSWLGPVMIQHTVGVVQSNYLRFLLSQGVDGFHDWSWGDGWVQSRLEGISLLPLGLGQTVSLLRLKQFLAARQ